ncbi:MAG TPA: histidine--tRNA ligase [Cyclobacteriaceae bacterium]|nr:histidine--tRNA ligase [Cyclobacteriaceae bacterium]
MDKPSLPKGTRDFGPATMAKRQFILENIRAIFRKYGFMPLETPAMENLSTLTGKYGEEGDQLLFRILNSGDYLKDVDQSTLDSKNSKQLASDITEKGLRYDLTVPFARYVVMNRHEITLPFKRYQIQPVWRADRPQKGRYREFYQCDADVVGTDSLICEAEILLMIKEAFLKLGIKDYTIKINHRSVLSGLAEITGLKDNETTLFVAIDKLDKIGESGVRQELEQKGVSKENIDVVFNVLNADNKASMLGGSEQAKKGLNDLDETFRLLDGYGVSRDHVEFDIKLARGLSYYTGCIFEVQINNVAIGSVSGGGRYDNLTQAFGSKEKLSGVGISFGIDRIYDAMEELQVFPGNTEVSSQVLVCHFDENAMQYGLKILHTLRQNSIASEIYPDITKKINKQLEYADKKMIPFTIMIGEDEIKSGLLTLKNMRSGEQLKKSLEDIVKLVKSPS